MKSLLLCLFIPFFSSAQLPSKEVIRENGITKMKVFRHDLPPIFKETIYSTDSTIVINTDAKEDTTVTHARTIYFDGFGRIVRNVLYHEGKEYLTEFAYDQNDRLVDRIVYIDGIENVKERVTQRVDSMYEYKRWTGRKLTEHCLTYPDSTIHTSFGLKKGQLPLYTFDRTMHYLQVAEYKKNKLLSLTKETWVRNAKGQIYLLEIDFKQYNRATKRNGRVKSYHEIFPVKADGEIESTLNHQRPRPYFFVTGRKSPLIAEYFYETSNANSLILRSDDRFFFSFSEDSQHYYFSYEYFDDTLEE